MGLCNSSEHDEFGHDMNRKDQYLDVSFRKGWYLTTVPVVAREKPDKDSPIIGHLEKGARIKMVAFTNWFVKIASPVDGYIQFVTVEECNSIPSGGGREIEEETPGTTEIIVQPGRLGLYFVDLASGELGHLNPNPQEILEIVGVKKGWRLVEVEGNPFSMHVLKEYIDGPDPYHLKFHRGNYFNNVNANMSYGNISLAETESDLFETSIQTMESSMNIIPLEIVKEAENSPRLVSLDVSRNDSIDIKSEKNEEGSDGDVEKKEQQNDDELNNNNKKKEEEVEVVVVEKEKEEDKHISRKRCVSDVRRMEVTKRGPGNKSSKETETKNGAEDENEEDKDFITIASEKTTTTVTTTITTTTKEHKKKQATAAPEDAEKPLITSIEPSVTTVSKEKKVVKEKLPLDNDINSFSAPVVSVNSEKTKNKRTSITKSSSEDDWTQQKKRKGSRRSLVKKQPSENNSRVFNAAQTWGQIAEGEFPPQFVMGPDGPIELGDPIPDTLSLYQIRRMKKVGRLLGDGFEGKKTHKRQVSETLQLLQSQGTLYNDGSEIIS